MTIAISIERFGSTHAQRVSEAYAETAHPDAVYGVLDRTAGALGVTDPYASREEQLQKLSELTKTLAGSVDVFNWSFGGSSPRNNEYLTEGDIEYAFERGTAVVTAAGNNYLNNNFPIEQRSPYDFTIGAMQTYADGDDIFLLSDNATLEIADYTNGGPKFVDFYTYGNNGTSFAAPRAMGYITHILGDNPDASLSEIRTVLEKNSKYMETGLDREPWTIQVLDPYDFENNTIRDGTDHVYARIFTDEAPKSAYEFNFDTDASIDARVRVEAAYEVLFKRNPDQQGLDYWTEQVESGSTSIHNLIHHFMDQDEYILSSEKETQVALIEQVQGLYHLFLGRESTDMEVDMCIDYIGQNQLSWSESLNTWLYTYGVANDSI
jgi:hypothetical protein